MAKFFKKGFKKITRKISKAQGTQNTLSWLLSLYLKLVYKTSSWSIIGLEDAQKLIPNSAAIACFWHGYMAMIPFMWRWPQKKIVALISGHSDGLVVARTFKRLNIDYVSGSTNRDGMKAFRALLEVLARKDIVGIIPDGPRGPAKKASEGIIYLAKHSKAPILPLAYATSRFITFKSWDRFRLPLPFSKGVFVYGDPLYFPETLPVETDSPIKGKSSPDLSFETYRQEVEKQISSTQDKADALLGIQ